MAELEPRLIFETRNYRDTALTVHEGVDAIYTTLLEGSVEGGISGLSAAVKAARIDPRGREPLRANLPRMIEMGMSRAGRFGLSRNALALAEEALAPIAPPGDTPPPPPATELLIAIRSLELQVSELREQRSSDTSNLSLSQDNERLRREIDPLRAGKASTSESQRAAEPTWSRRVRG